LPGDFNILGKKTQTPYRETKKLC